MSSLPHKCKQISSGKYLPMDSMHKNSLIICWNTSQHTGVQ